MQDPADYGHTLTYEFCCTVESGFPSIQGGKVRRKKWMTVKPNSGMAVITIDRFGLPVISGKSVANVLLPGLFVVLHLLQGNST